MLNKLQIFINLTKNEVIGVILCGKWGILDIFGRKMTILAQIGSILLKISRICDILWVIIEEIGVFCHCGGGCDHVGSGLLWNRDLNIIRRALW